MTDKRFTISSESNQNIWDNEKKCYYSSIDAIQLCDLLNELKQEAKDNEHYHTVVLKNYKAISKENEQLQSEVSKLTDLLGTEIEKNARLLQEINSLKIENMRLNESIKDLNDVLARYEEKELKE